MKKMILSLGVVLASVAVQAKSIKSESIKLDASSISQIVRLAKVERNSVDKTVSILVTDNGRATDVSPTGQVYLTFTAYAEMGNISTSFKIADILGFISAVRKSAGIYEVKTTETRGEASFVDVTYTIDTNNMFSDESKKRAQCGDDFCDGALETSIDVKEVVTEAKY